MICFCYFLFVVPMALVNMVDDNADYPRVHLSLFCLYWLQYSLNFVVYAARGEQYRKAYSYFLKRVSIMFQCCTHTIHIWMSLKLNLLHPRFTNGFVAKHITTRPQHLFAWLRIIRYGSVQKLH